MDRWFRRGSSVRCVLVGCRSLDVCMASIGHRSLEKWMAKAVCFNVILTSIKKKKKLSGYLDFNGGVFSNAIPTTSICNSPPLPHKMMAGVQKL